MDSVTTYEFIFAEFPFVEVDTQPDVTEPDFRCEEFANYLFSVNRIEYFEERERLLEELD